MSSKRKLITVGVIIILSVILTIIYIFIPKIDIKLNGSKDIVLTYEEEYQELGATAYLKSGFKKQKIPVTISGVIDNKKLGKYTVKYYAQVDGISKSSTREVNVVDNVPPIIKINKEISGCKINKVIDIDVTVSDNYDGDISDKLKYNIENETIKFHVSDSSDNLSEQEATIKYIDNQSPELTLNGPEVVKLVVGEKYEDAGAKAMDSCDGDLTSQIKVDNNVNTAKSGSYKVTYSVTDSYGNVKEINRSVVVTVPSSSNNNNNDDDNPNVTNGVIYLTFDDGPGPYTLDILNTLDKYNVKATFFVTSQFSNYLDMITEEYKRGHTVGVHTYSHKWAIYDSVDTYLDDFNKMANIVYEKTGVQPKYFRFPGGTSNEVSIKHSKGIMTTLAKLMTEKGYTYFDWNVDCGDTHKTQTVDYILKTTKSSIKGNGSYIVLMHDIKKNTRTALPTLIEYFKGKGYTFKAIDDSTPLKQFKPHN